MSWTDFALYAFLFWLLIYWWTSLALVIYMIRKYEDIKFGEFLIITLFCIVAGPYALLRCFVDYAKMSGLMNKIVIKKCTKREVWEALGGKE